MRHGEVKRQVGAAQVDGDRFVEFFRLEVVDRRPDAVDAGIGDDNVEPPEFLRKLIDRLAHPVFIGNVGNEHQRLPASLLDFPGGPVDLASRMAEQADFCPFRREFEGGSLADTRARPRYQSHLRFEFHEPILSPDRRFCRATTNGKGWPKVPRIRPDTAR